MQLTEQHISTIREAIIEHIERIGHQAWPRFEDALAAIAAPESQGVGGLDFPNGVGYWAFDGTEYKRPARCVVNVTAHMPCLNSAYPYDAIQIDLSPYWKPKGSLDKQGKWTRLHMPWDAQPAAHTVAADWMHTFPPEWDRHPWANYACLQASFSTFDGITFMWYYYERKPEWGERSYNWVDGKWGYYSPVERAPLSLFFDTRDTLTQRPGQGE